MARAENKGRDMKLQVVVDLARSIPDSADSRPTRLRELRDAEHPTCLYYRFLHDLVDKWGPLDVIEIGTYVGTSAAHLAVCNYAATGGVMTFGQVTTIDVNADAKRCVDELAIPNIRALTGDSHAAVDRVKALLGGDKVDVLYVDGNHTFTRAYGEYYLYRPLVREGGLMIFDDVGLEMDGDEMNVMWDMIPDPKCRVDHLHPNTGFGIVEKREGTNVLTPLAVMERAAPIITSRRRRA